ncbi:acetylornithine deacetylase [Bifidobacterium ramosum]|nr:M20/M25/M40 family metallo-hydrolase [Bifidobacterium ramosum]KAB8286756.1 acetylornithine deacetylase [Bifidobacterium ramosum]
MTMDPRILEQRDSIVDRWRTICRFASTADNLPEIHRAARWLESQLQPLFSEVGTIPVEGYGPVVYGIERGRSAKTLMLYNHYDVQHAGDEKQWIHPPYEAQIHDGVLYARGACDDKADVAGRLDSFRLWKQEHGGVLPYTVIYFADPCEEIGSPGLENVLRDHAELFRSDACLWESYLREEDGSPSIGFGCRGSLSVRISVRALKDGIHPSYGTVVRSAPLEVMKIVAGLTTDDGLVAVKGMRDLAIKASPEALRRVRRIGVPSESLRLNESTDPNPQADMDELRRRFIFEPGMSLAAYDLDSSSVRSIPPECSARVRFSLVPGMDPKQCLALIRAHVAQRNPDAVVEMIDSIEPAYSSPDSCFGQSITEAAQSAYGKPPVIYDIMTGAGPGAMFLKYLGAPIASPTGTLRPDGNMHGYNEHGAVEDFLTHANFTLTLLRELESHGFGRGDQ